MPIPDVPSISYGATDNEVYDWQVRDRDKLWAEQCDRVHDWLDKTMRIFRSAKALIL